MIKQSDFQMIASYFHNSLFVCKARICLKPCGNNLFQIPFGSHTDCWSRCSVELSCCSPEPFKHQAMRLKNLVCFILLLSALAVDAQNLPFQTVKEHQWIKSWLLCGPIPLQPPTDPAKSWNHLDGYENALDGKTGGESNLVGKVGSTLKAGKQSLKWISHTSPDSVIDLRKSLSRNPTVFAYAYTEVTSARAEMKFLALGTNDGGSLWVNGIKVWDYPYERGLKPDNDLIPVALKKGVNKLLLKVEQRGNRWEFCARFLPFSVSEFTKGDFFRIDANEKGESILSSRYAPVVLDELVQKVSIKIKNTEGYSIYDESRNASFCGKLGMRSDQFQAYKAQIDVQLKNGESAQLNQTFFAGKRSEYVLFDNKKTDYRIALDGQASESEQWAATELQKWLKEISGATFPIQTLDQQHSGPQIIVGFNAVTQSKTNANAPLDTDESYFYTNSGSDILIYGGKRRGTLYGVMAFLENELGCRWYTPGKAVIPKRAQLKFTRYNHHEGPGIRVRNDFYFEAFDPIWATRNKMNGSMSTPKQPGGIESYWSVHTFYPLMPPEEFFDKHPEYYSELEGKRVHDHAQLCLSNPDVLKIITERIKKRMRESPEYLIYDVSQNDWYNACQCNQCQSIVKREGTESGIMIWFVNQVADAVRSEFPDKFIGTLAYQYTRKPPLRIRPKDNVVVRFCSIECCFSHDFKTCPENQDFLKELNTWSSLAPHLYIWDYVVNFSHYVMPYPNFNVLQSNIQTFRENNAIGIMEQAAYQSRGGEFAELRSYVISKLLWNPDCNTEEVINDFMAGYYGRSGRFVRQYFDLLHDQVTPETHIHLGLTPTDRIFTDEFVRKSYSLFEEAKKVAENEEILNHVEMASLPILYLKCRRLPVLSRYDGTYAAFCKIADREKVTFFSEAGGREAFHDWVKNAK